LSVLSLSGKAGLAYSPVGLFFVTDILNFVLIGRDGQNNVQAEGRNSSVDECQRPHFFQIDIYCKIYRQFRSVNSPSSVFYTLWYQITVIIPPLIEQRPPKKPLPGRPSPLVFGARTCLVLCYSSSTGNATKGIPVSSEELSASPPAGPYTAISDVQPSKALGDMSQSRDTRICVSPVQFLKA